MTELFRKKAIDNSSTTENIDKAIVVTPTAIWLSIIVGILVIVAVLLWGIFGRMPTKVTANGIYIPNQNTYTLSSEVTGIVESVAVEPNQRIDVGDVLYTVKTEDLEKDKAEITKRIEIVNGITIYSKNDIANSDTQSLLEIKLQMDSGRSTLAQSNKLLELKNEKKYEAENELENAKNEYRKAQDAVDEAQATLAKSQADYADGAGIPEIKAKKQELTPEEYAQYINTYFPGVDPTKEPDDPGMDVAFVQAIATLTSRLEDARNVLSVRYGEYSSAESKYSMAVAEVESVSQQIDSGKVGDAVTRNQLATQFNATKELILDSLINEAKKYDELINKNSVVSPIKGVVLDVGVSAGRMVGQGSSAVTIREVKDDDDIVVCYVGITDGKKIKPGMPVKIYPSVVNKFEYGNIEATVLYVDDYVTSLNTIANELGSNSLVEAFASSGPVIGVKCKLEKDDTTASGYLWSSKKASDIVIPQGTIVTADIITEEKKPISLLIPFIKEKISGINSSGN